MRDETGQILPLLAVMMILLVGAGMLVLWLGLSTTIASKAQTAADAAALEGEQELVDELRIVRIGPDGQVLPPYYSKQQVCQAAARYAADNHGYMSCLGLGDIQFLPSGLFGTDVEVTVHSQQTLPSGSIDAGKGAVTQARASTDPFSQDSPPLTSTTTSCDASVVDGTPFDPPTKGTGPGFFAGKDTNYTQGCEPKLAGKLQALATAKGLHLVGVRGYDTSTTAVSSAGGGQPVADQIDAVHSCGAASTVDGLPKHGAPNEIDDATLKSFGLTQPFPGKPDELVLAGHGGCTEEVSASPGATQPVGFGNSDVHLVPLTGGPVGSLALGPLGPVTPISAQGMQLGCQIWAIGQSLGVNQNVMLSAFLAAWAESTMTNITTYTPGQKDSLGMFQQQESEGWGYWWQEIIPQDAITMYFKGVDVGSPFYNGRGSTAGAIADDAQTPGQPPWVLAQEVQGSSAGRYTGGDNYKMQLPEATTMIDNIKSGGCKGQ